jgi:hypothetical protein
MTSVKCAQKKEYFFAVLSMDCDVSIWTLQ